MTISVTNKTSNAMTVSCSYPAYVAPIPKPLDDYEGCTITWKWKASGSTDTKTGTSTTSGVSIRWAWTWSGTAWTANGWSVLSAPASTKNYSDASGYSGTIDLQGVDPGTRPSPPSTGSFSVGQGGHVDANTGTATYSGPVTKTTYSWVEDGWSHNASSSLTYDDGTYSGVMTLQSVAQGSRPSGPSGSPSSSTSTYSTTTSGTAHYTGTAYTASSGATITRTKMYLNGTYQTDGTASNNFSYTFSPLLSGTTYTLSVQWFSSGDTFVGSNDVSDTTLDTTPTSPTVTSRSDAGLSLSWGTVIGATSYQLDYKPDVNTVWTTATTGSTSVSISGLAYGLLYDFRARAFVDGAWRAYSPISNATVNPKTPTLDGDYTSGIVTLIVGGMGGTTFDSVTVERRLISNDSFVDSKPVTVNGGAVTWSIAATDIAKYKFRAYSTSGSVSSLGYSSYVSFVRPVNFSWQYSSISSGSNAVVDRRDWNNLAAKINEFRVNYKGLSSYSFTTITTANVDITAALFNQLVSAANGLASFMTNNVMPSTRSSGDPFYASYLNNIVTSINSIS